MHIQISHRTTYGFDQPVDYGLQRLRLTPTPGPTQEIVGWHLELNGCETQVNYDDHFGNRVTLARIEPGVTSVEVTATGGVVTGDRAGVVGPDQRPVPHWFYSGSTPLTEAGRRIEELANQVSDIGDVVERAHSLSGLIRSVVDYRIGGTEPSTTAEEAVWAGEGVCQDHTHVFLSAARLAGLPSRYVSGYLLVDDEVSASASHAWAEAYIEGLGWVGFDVSNGVAADDHYVRLAVGRDYSEAAPIAGIRYGSGGERLEVHLDVTEHHLDQAEQQQQQ